MWSSAARSAFDPNDLYPESHTYAQIYQGPAALGTDGTRVVGSEVVLTHRAVPENRVLLLDDYDAIFGADGTWTIEIVTETPFGTPFGIERLAHRSFEIRRTLSIRGQLTTLE